MHDHDRDTALRWSRLWHREARRLWRLLIDAEPLTAEETEQVTVRLAKGGA